MSNTPETDALREAIDNGAAVEAEMTSLAMKLERERDEAREDATNYYAKIGELKQERDEAREEAERYRLEANAMMLQRDEARMKLQ